MKLKPVFIGQMPASESDEGEALPQRSGTSGMRIVQMMGIVPEVFNERFVRMNVSPFYDPDGFSPEYNSLQAKNILPLLEHRRVILLGPAVASAFGFTRSSYYWCRWFDHETLNISFAVMPHPSGRNYLYNEPQIVDMVKRFLDEVWEMS